MEATGGFEPPDRGFADPRLNLLATSPMKWSGRRDSNPRPSPWQGDALPLRYFRSYAGAEGQNRTDDTAIFSRVLYRLSYLGRRAYSTRFSPSCQELRRWNPAASLGWSPGDPGPRYVERPAWVSADRRGSRAAAFYTAVPILQHATAAVCSRRCGIEKPQWGVSMLRPLPSNFLEELQQDPVELGRMVSDEAVASAGKDNLL